MKGKGSNKDTMKQVEMYISGVDNKNLKKSMTLLIYIFYNCNSSRFLSPDPTPCVSLSNAHAYTSSSPLIQTRMNTLFLSHITLPTKHFQKTC